MKRTRKQNIEHINKYRFLKKIEEMQYKGTICQICDNRKAQKLHHVDEDHNNNKRSNLTPVCHACHTDIYHESDKRPDICDQNTHRNAIFERGGGGTFLQEEKIGPKNVSLGSIKVFSKGNINIILKNAPTAERVITRLGYEFKEYMPQFFTIIALFLCISLMGCGTTTPNYRMDSSTKCKLMSAHHRGNV